jgi:hypothetical protein
MNVEAERDDNIYDGNWKFQGEFVESHAGAASWEYLIEHMCGKPTWIVSFFIQFELPYL